MIVYIFVHVALEIINTFQGEVKQQHTECIAHTLREVEQLDIATKVSRYRYLSLTRRKRY